MVFGNLAVQRNIIEVYFVTQIGLREINTRGDRFFDIDHSTPPLIGSNH
jgi:hypothetical protein